MNLKYRTIHQYIKNRLTFVFLSVYFLIPTYSAFTELPLVVINETDGSEMVLIPSGTYLMGSTLAQTAALIHKDDRLSTDFFHAEHPQHSVSLPAFYIDRSPVSNAQYAVFIAATGHLTPKYWTHTPQIGAEESFPVGAKNGTHPVVGVSYTDAVAYCEWAGKRLTTEAEWEKAARGRLVNQNYPWGNDSSRNHANTVGAWGKDKWLWTSPIGSFPANGYGLYDMAGNVFEWCTDWYAADYYQYSQHQNPQGPETGQTRMLRGGSWSNNLLGIYQMRCTYRFHARPETRNLTIGFRCAATPTP